MPEEIRLNIVTRLMARLRMSREEKRAEAWRRYADAETVASQAFQAWRQSVEDHDDAVVKMREAAILGTVSAEDGMSLKARAKELDVAWKARVRTFLASDKAMARAMKA